MVTERRSDILNWLLTSLLNHEPVGSKPCKSLLTPSSNRPVIRRTVVKNKGCFEKACYQSGRMPSVAGFQRVLAWKHLPDSLVPTVAENEARFVKSLWLWNSFKLRIFCKRSRQLVNRVLSGCTEYWMLSREAKLLGCFFDIVVLGQHSLGGDALPQVEV